MDTDKMIGTLIRIRDSIIATSNAPSSIFTNEDVSNFSETLNCATMILGKEKKALLIWNEDSPARPKCPTCGEEIESHTQWGDRCWNCGQVFDWEEFFEAQTEYEETQV